VREVGSKGALCLIAVRALALAFDIRIYIYRIDIYVPQVAGACRVTHGCVCVCVCVCVVCMCVLGALSGDNYFVRSLLKYCQLNRQHRSAGRPSARSLACLYSCQKLLGFRGIARCDSDKTVLV